MKIQKSRILQIAFTVFCLFSANGFAQNLQYERALPMPEMRAARVNIVNGDGGRIQYLGLSRSGGANIPRIGTLDADTGLALSASFGQVRNQQFSVSAYGHAPGICFMACYPDGIVLEGYNRDHRPIYLRYELGQYSTELRLASDDLMALTPFTFAPTQPLRDLASGAARNRKLGCSNLLLADDAALQLDQCMSEIEARRLSDGQTVWTLPIGRIALAPDQRLIAHIGIDGSLSVVNLRGQILSTNSIIGEQGFMPSGIIWGSAERILVSSRANETGKVFAFRFNAGTQSLTLQFASSALRPTFSMGLDANGRVYGQNEAGKNVRLSADGQTLESTPFSVSDSRARWFRVGEKVVAFNDQNYAGYAVDSLQELWRKPDLYFSSPVVHESLVKNNVLWNIRAGLDNGGNPWTGVVVLNPSDGAQIYATPTPTLSLLPNAVKHTHVGSKLASLAVFDLKSQLSLFDANARLIWTHNLARVSSISALKASNTLIFVGDESHGALLDAGSGSELREVTGVTEIIEDGGVDLVMRSSFNRRSTLENARTGELIKSMQFYMRFDAASRKWAGVERNFDSCAAVVSDARGNELRRFPIPTGCSGPFSLLDGALIFTDVSGTTAYAFDIATGALRFSAPYGLPATLETSGNRWVANYSQGPSTVRASLLQLEVDPASGAHAWRWLGTSELPFQRYRYFGQTDAQYFATFNVDRIQSYQKPLKLPWAMEVRTDILAYVANYGANAEFVTLDVVLENRSERAARTRFAINILDDRTKVTLQSCEGCRTDLSATPARLTLAPQERIRLSYLVSAAEEDRWILQDRLNLIHVSIFPESDILDTNIRNNQVFWRFGEAIFADAFEALP